MSSYKVTGKGAQAVSRAVQPIGKHLVHADNPPVQDYVAKHSELATHFSTEIYGNVSQEVIDKINFLEIPLKHFATTSVGYVRSERFV